MRNSATLSLIIAAALFTGCSKASRLGRTGGKEGTRGGTSAVARVNGKVVTEAELLASAKGHLGRAEAEYQEKVHGLKSQALDELINKQLLDAKAKAAGTTSEALIEREVTAKIPEPSPAEVQGIYDRTKASGRPLPPFDQVKDDIVKFVKAQQSEEAKRAFFTKLRSDAKVEILLPPLLPPKVEVAADGPSRGAENAPVTIVEFSDYECPYCGRAEEAVKQVLEAYKGKVRVVYRDYPLPTHTQAKKASEAALCAGDQGKYWEMHAKLFANQTALAVLQLKQHAKELGLDGAKFDSCLDSGDKGKLVDASKKAGDEAGVNGTPAFFINGRLLSGAQPFEKFKAIIDHELKGS